MKVKWGNVQGKHQGNIRGMIRSTMCYGCKKETATIMAAVNEDSFMYEGVYSSLPRAISPCHDFIPVVQYFRLPISHLIGKKVFVLCAVIIVKRILEPEVASVIPKANQNFSSEICFRIVLTNFKIAVQENTVLDFTQFVKISDNCNSFIMFHRHIVLMCIILCFGGEYFSPSLNSAEVWA